MDTTKTGTESNKNQDDFSIDESALSEIMQISDELSVLDQESRSMIFLMSLSSFNLLQNKFILIYKKFLQLRNKRNVSITEEEASLYDSLVECQENFMNSPLEEEKPSPAQPESSPVESSLLRTLWRRYRIEFFVKIMLIIFLLKLPYFCYFVTIIVYILYCLGFFRLISSITQSLRNSHNAQSIVRFFLNILDSIDPHFIVQLGQGQQNVAQTAPHTGSQTGPQPVSENVQQSSSQTSQNITRIATESQVTQTADNTFGQQSSALFSGSSSQLPPGSTSEQVTGSQSTSPEQSSTGQQPATAGQPVREKPTYLEKFIYQVFFSFILSLLPWWEPNPIYLEE